MSKTRRQRFKVRGAEIKGDGLLLSFSSKGGGGDQYDGAI